MVCRRILNENELIFNLTSKMPIVVTIVCFEEGDNYIKMDCYYFPDAEAANCIK